MDFPGGPLSYPSKGFGSLGLSSVDPTVLIFLNLSPFLFALPLWCMDVVPSSVILILTQEKFLSLWKLGLRILEGTVWNTRDTVPIFFVAIILAGPES